MKKLTFSFLACFTFIQAVQAETPTLLAPIHFSLQHFDTITTTLRADPDFQDIISPGEFITDLRIQRRSRDVQEGNVYVNITTRRQSKNSDMGSQEVYISDTKEPSKSTRNRRGPFKNKRSKINKTYVATLLLTPATIGSPNITVVSIVPVVRHKKFIGKQNKHDQKKENAIDESNEYTVYENIEKNLDEDNDFILDEDNDGNLEENVDNDLDENNDGDFEENNLDENNDGNLEENVENDPEENNDLDEYQDNELEDAE